MKFNVLFWCLGFFFFDMLIYTAEQGEWAEQQHWVLNAGAQEACDKKLFRTGSTRLGGQATYMGTSVLFYIIGLGFGTSYSLLEVDCGDFVRTHWAKKIARAVLGCALAEGIYELFIGAFPEKGTFLTRFCFEGIVPQFIVPFIIYGPFQVFCQWIGLVDRDSAADEGADDNDEAQDKNEG